jgi:stalled ribosome rescue protein Dom34
MKTKAGLWIDHKQAIVVTVGDKGEEIRRIASEVEKQLQRTGDSPMKGSYEAQQVPSDDSRQRAFTGQLNTYYDEVIASLREATAILILGPGEAKDELRKRLEEKNLGSRIVGVETVDKMTEPQIAAKARAHFANNQWG